MPSINPTYPVVGQRSTVASAASSSTAATLQDNRLVADIGRCFETFGFQTLEQKAEAVSLPIQNLHWVARLVEKDKEHRVEGRYLYIQLFRVEPLI